MGELRGEDEGGRGWGERGGEGRVGKNRGEGRAKQRGRIAGDEEMRKGVEGDLDEGVGRAFCTANVDL